MCDEEPDFTNNESRLLGEKERSRTEDKTKRVQCSKDEIIEKIIEEVYKKYLLSKKNHGLQQKLAMFISGPSEKDSFSKFSYSEEADELALGKILDSITALEDESQQVCISSLADIETLKKEITQKKESLMELEKVFKEITEKAALHSVNSETGKCFSIKEVKELLAKEEEVSKTLQEYQLHSIQKRHHLNLVMEKKKNLAEGTIDFAEYEMMCIETQNNKEIIQPISEEIKNIKEKASNMINVLSHLGQKLYLAQKEKVKAANAEKKLEAELNIMRDMLFEERMKYTKMKQESKELQHKCILLQYPRLIEDYNDIQQKNEEAHKELQQLKTIYEEEMKIIKK